MADKKDKKEKKVSAKKLPGLFKKKYTEDKFKKKVLKKIYIDADKKLVEKQFRKQKDSKGNTIICVDKTAELSNADFIRCKTIAKEVNICYDRVRIQGSGCPACHGRQNALHPAAGGMIKPDICSAAFRACEYKNF